MIKFRYRLAAGALALILFGTLSLRAKWIEANLPAMKSADLTSIPVPVEDQRRALVEFEHRLCESFLACSQSTHTQDVSMIVGSCRAAATQIERIDIPARLPASVFANLRAYRQSMIHTTRKLADGWESTQNNSSGSFLTYLKNWELETCSPDSVPQKVRRLYGLDRLTGKTSVTCTEIAELHLKLREELRAKFRAPTSAQ